MWMKFNTFPNSSHINCVIWINFNLDPAHNGSCYYVNDLNLSKKDQRVHMEITHTFLQSMSNLFHFVILRLLFVLATEHTLLRMFLNI